MRPPLIATMILALLFQSAAATITGDEPGTAGTFTLTGSLTETSGRTTAALLPDGRVFVLGGGRDVVAERRWDLGSTAAR